MVADLSVDLNGLKLKNPILCASGTFGYCDEFSDCVDVANLGSIVTKAITLEPRAGNDWQRVFETEVGMINSVGLENVGINAFVKNKLPILQSKNISFVLNVAGSTFDEYVKVAEIAQKNEIKAIELNISCPNVKHGCLEFGTDENSLYDLVKGVREVYKNFIIVKLTPNVTEVEKIGLAAQKAGADAVSAINTVKAAGIKLFFDKNKHKFITTQQIQGGLSGLCVKPIALGVVKRLSNVLEIPVIGMGGIHSLGDVLEFFAFGAEAVQIGTANFTYPNISEKIINDLKEFMEENQISTVKELKTLLKERVQ